MPEGNNKVLTQTPRSVDFPDFPTVEQDSEKPMNQEFLNKEIK